MEIYYGLSPGLSLTLWYEEEGRLSAANVVKLIPDPTTHAISHAHSTTSAFELFLTQ